MCVIANGAAQPERGRENTCKDVYFLKISASCLTHKHLEHGHEGPCRSRRKHDDKRCLCLAIACVPLFGHRVPACLSSYSSETAVHVPRSLGCCRSLSFSLSLSCYTWFCVGLCVQVKSVFQSADGAPTRNASAVWCSTCRMVHDSPVVFCWFVCGLGGWVHRSLPGRTFSERIKQESETRAFNLVCYLLNLNPVYLKRGGTVRTVPG